MSVSERMMVTWKFSWIRKMFEEGTTQGSARRRECLDFSLGNRMCLLRGVITMMSELSKTMSHGYMPNAGFPDARAEIAEYASDLYEVPLSGDDIVMSCGAGGGINVVLKAVTNPGDEIIAISPYFVEYGFYAENQAASS